MVEPKGEFRYRGTSPFQDTAIDRKILFGRDREKRSLLNLVLAEDLVVLFARSGMGKTSLINAGLLEPLRRHGYLPMTVRLNVPGDDLLGAVRDALPRALQAQGVEQVGGAGDDAWAFFDSVEFWSEADDLVTPVLILDQFEEVFTLRTPADRRRIGEELRDLIRGRADPSGGSSPRRPRVKILLSLREDFLAHLETFAKEIPGVLQNRFRLGPLTREGAMDVIRGTARAEDEAFETDPFEFSDEALNRMVDFLSHRRVGQESRVGDEVEPVLLQLIGQSVEHRVAAGALAVAGARGGPVVVSDQDLGTPRQMRQVLEGFYERTLRSIRPPKVSRKVRKLCERRLISTTGRRLTEDGEEIERRFGISTRQLQELVDARLLRAEPRLGGTFYELSHDTLVAPIQKARARRERWRALWGGVAVVLLLVVPLMIWNPFAPDYSDEVLLLLREAENVPPELRRGLVQWSDSLTDADWAATSGGRSPGAPEVETLEAYLREVGGYSRTINLYNRIATSDTAVVDDVALLYRWYFEQEPADREFEARAIYAEIARQALGARPIVGADLVGFEERAVQVAAGLAEDAYRFLAEALPAIPGALDRVQSSIEAAAVAERIDRAAALVDGMDSVWFHVEGPLPNRVAMALDSVEDGFAIEKARVVRGLEDAFWQVRSRYAPAFEFGSGDVDGLDRTADALHVPADWLEFSRLTKDLLGRSFARVAPVLVTPPVPGGRPSLDPEPLDSILALYDDAAAFQSLIEGGATHPRNEIVLRSVAASSLTDAVRSRIAQAMTYTVEPPRVGRAGPEAELRLRLDEFEAAAGRFTAILAQDRALGGTPAADPIFEVVVLEATDLLAKLAELVEMDGLYQPAEPGLAAWQADRPASWAAFDAIDEASLMAYLSAQRTRMAALADDAATILGFWDRLLEPGYLQAVAPVLGESVMANQRIWIGIVEALDGYAVARPGNSLTALERFVLRDMSVASLAGCAALQLDLPTGAARDYFDRRRLALARRLADRCQALAAAGA
ncbi:MAG: hypothetical protein RJQ04_05685 [Longimicrobiales bacterium]